MSSKQMICAGCLNTVKGRQHLKCSKCAKIYDILCAGLSEKRFNSFYGPGTERKQNWVCPECINKKPKSDTTNTPVRAIPGRMKSLQNNYLTIRRIADVVSLKLQDKDILNCTRVAHKNKDSKAPRAIVVQLISTRCRDEFYSAVSRYNRSHPKCKLGSSLLNFGGPTVPIYVSEHLSPANKSLHAAARIKARELTYKFVWVRNGRIFMRKDETSPFVHVKSEKTLDSLK
ncbi:hypothetical protein ACJJTC_000001 [Scirpophaga incertulas]